MKKGGYQIIDLENRPLLDGIGMLYEGIYDKIEGTRKCILISGLNFEATEYHDFFAIPYLDGTIYCFIMHSVDTGGADQKILITIADTDVVTVTQL